MSSVIPGRRRFVCALAALAVTCAHAQTPPSPPAGPPPAAEAAKQEHSDNLRIRGRVERVDESGAVVQLSQGLSIRIDLPPGANIMLAIRISVGDLKPGLDLRVRTRAGASSAAGAGGAPPATTAADVLALGLEPGRADAIDASEIGARGVLKAIDRTPEGVVLVLTDKGTDRRLQTTSETTYWRMQSAAARDIRPGLLLSALIVRGPDGAPRTQRAVFGSAPAGASLPL